MRRGKKTGTTPSTTREKRAYDLAHRAWRAGAIPTFYFGMRAPGDPTVVWRVAETEYAADAYDTVMCAVADALTAAGIANVAFGGTWCGYRELTVEYADGTVVVERWNGVRVVREKRGVVLPVAA